MFLCSHLWSALKELFIGTKMILKGTVSVFMNTICKETYAKIDEWAFSFAGRRFWNSFPVSVHLLSCLSFHSQLRLAFSICLSTTDYLSVSMEWSLDTEIGVGDAYFIRQRCDRSYQLQFDTVPFSITLRRLLNLTENRLPRDVRANSQQDVNTIINTS